MMRILIVEDDMVVAMDAEDALRDAGFEVVGIARRCSTAIELASTQHPDLVVMDVQLAGERDGIEAATIIWQSLGIPTLFATGQTSPELTSRADVAHPLGWLRKPITREQLVAEVNSAALARLP